MLEIGSWCGISTMTRGRALENIGATAYAIDCDIWHHAGDICYDARRTEIRRECNAFNHDVFKFNIQTSIGWGQGGELIGDSRVSLKGLRDGFFDVVYVHGCHGYDSVSADIENAFRLATPGGIICGEDCDCSPEMMQRIPQNALQLDDYLMPPTNTGVHPGVVLAVDRLPGVPHSYGTFWAFYNVADRKDPPFSDSVFPIDVEPLPRRIPEFVPAHLRHRFEEHFAGPGGLLPWHPAVAAPKADSVAGSPE